MNWKERQREIKKKHRKQSSQLVGNSNWTYEIIIIYAAAWCPCMWLCEYVFVCMLRCHTNLLLFYYYYSILFNIHGRHTHTHTWYIAHTMLLIEWLCMQMCIHNGNKNYNNNNLHRGKNVQYAEEEKDRRVW